MSLAWPTTTGDYRESSFEELKRMPNTKGQRAAEVRRVQLARLADLLDIEIADEDLSTLAAQLSALEALDESELRDQPPILKMDAEWHD